jgi:hypothetical protein
MITAERKQALIDKAQQRHGEIKLLGTCSSIDECFNFVNNRLCFWYNKENDSTSIVMEDVATYESTCDV